MMTDAELLFKLLAILSILLGLAVAAKKLFFSKTPQPFEVQPVEESMSRREQTLIYGNLDARLTSVERRLDKHLMKVKADIAGLHEKINEQHGDLMRAIGRLEGRV